MSKYYTHPADAKARVWRERFPFTGEYAWAANRPGGTYLVGQGFHFDTWRDAIEYATRSGDAR